MESPFGKGALLRRSGLRAWRVHREPAAKRLVAHALLRHDASISRSRAMSHRVASLLPSATEIVCGVGAEADLVGISHECDFPESVRHLPAMTRARLRPVRTSRGIDREVRAVLQNALAVYEIELARLEAARPDVIVTQDLCDVCAVSFNDVCAATAALLRQDIRIVNLHPTRLDDIWADIGRVADALGRAAEGAGVVRALQARVSDITTRGARRAVQEGRVYVADGNAYFNRPGPRIVESLEILAACLHPEAFEDFRSKHRASVRRVDADLKPHAF